MMTLYFSLPYSLNTGLSMNPELGWHAASPKNHPFPAPYSTGITGLDTATPSFLPGCWDLTSGPQTCVAVFLPTEHLPSSQGHVL